MSKGLNASVAHQIRFLSKHPDGPSQLSTSPILHILTDTTAILDISASIPPCSARLLVSLPNAIPFKPKWYPQQPGAPWNNPKPSGTLPESCPKPPLIAYLGLRLHSFQPMGITTNPDCFKLSAHMALPSAVKWQASFPHRRQEHREPKEQEPQRKPTRFHRGCFWPAKWALPRMPKNNLLHLTIALAMCRCECQLFINKHVQNQLVKGSRQ